MASRDGLRIFALAPCWRRLFLGGTLLAWAVIFQCQYRAVAQPVLSARLDSGLITNFFNVAFPIPGGDNGITANHRIMYCYRDGQAPWVIFLVKPDPPKLQRGLISADCEKPLSDVMMALGAGAGTGLVKAELGWQPWQLEFTVSGSSPPLPGIAPIKIPTDEIDITLEDGTVVKFHMEVDFEGPQTILNLYDSASTPQHTTPCVISEAAGDNACLSSKNAFLKTLFADKIFDHSFDIAGVARATHMTFLASSQSLTIGGIVQISGIPDSQLFLKWAGDPLSFSQAQTDHENCGGISFDCIARNAARDVLSQAATDTLNGKPLRPITPHRAYPLTVGGRQSMIRAFSREVFAKDDLIELHGYIVFEGVQ